MHAEGLARLQQLLAEVAFQRKLWQEETANALKKIEDEGMEIIRPDPAPFAAATAPLREQFAGTAIGDLARRIEETP